MLLPATLYVAQPARPHRMDASSNRCIAMTYYSGRPIDHIHLRNSDFAASRAFYAAIQQVLGIKIAFSGDNWFQVD